MHKCHKLLLAGLVAFAPCMAPAYAQTSITPPLTLPKANEVQSLPLSIMALSGVRMADNVHETLAIGNGFREFYLTGNSFRNRMELHGNYMVKIGAVNSKSGVIIGVIVMQKDVNGKIQQVGYKVLKYLGIKTGVDMPTPSGDVISINIG